MIIPEAAYRSTMQEQVEPYLQARRSSTLLYRDGELYCDSYRADDPCGAVLISHGFMETADKYYELIYYFLRAGYHVCVPEHCGHGRSYRMVPGEDLSLVHVDTYERYVEDLHTVADYAAALWPELPLYLFAHSMGGGIGAALAAEYPDLFAGVILNAPMIRPDTNGVPWGIAKALCRFFCAIGKERDYVMGHHPYTGHEKFENSAAACRERFDYYQEKREANPLFQMSAVSYQWLRQAVRLHEYLIGPAIDRIRAPVLLLQAEEETFVSNAQEEVFIQRLVARHGSGSATLCRIPASHHEIFLSESAVLEGYWQEILSFLQLPRS